LQRKKETREEELKKLVAFETMHEFLGQQYNVDAMHA
jgi:hypothetical protein